jgi:FMN-dependent NADH-azoreductase
MDHPMPILHITSSANPGASNSSMLGRETTAHLQGDVTTRDTNAALPAIDSAWIAANFTPAADRTTEQSARLSLSDALISEIQNADTLVISTPLYNFSIPSTLKAWIDHICRSGITFNYTEKGPVGLLTGKRAIIVIATGGTPTGSNMDFASNYLRFVLGFIGITDVQIIAADRVMAQGEQAIIDARTTIAAL